MAESAGPDPLDVLRHQAQNGLLRAMLALEPGDLRNMLGFTLEHDRNWALEERLAESLMEIRAAEALKDTEA